MAPSDRSGKIIENAPDISKSAVESEHETIISLNYQCNGSVATNKHLQSCINLIALVLNWKSANSIFRLLFCFSLWWQQLLSLKLKEVKTLKDQLWSYSVLILCIFQDQKQSFKSGIPVSPADGELSCILENLPTSVVVRFRPLRRRFRQLPLCWQCLSSCCATILQRVAVICQKQQRQRALRCSDAHYSMISKLWAI